MDVNEFIARAYDSDAFTTSQTTAGYVNPEYWNRQVLEHVKANLVVAPLGKQYTDLLVGDGDVLNITVGVEPAAAASVAESAAISITAYEKVPVIFTPSEVGAAYQLTNKEKSRAFINVMADMTAQLGYQLALKKDTALVSLLQTSAGASVVADGVDASALASSNTIDFDDIVNGKKAMMLAKLQPKQLIVGVEQYLDLIKDEAFRDAAQFGGSEAVRNGFIGRIAGLDVFMTTQIAATTSSTAKALVLGIDGAGVPSFGICPKRNPYLETEYHALLRYTDIVAVEDYDIKMLRTDGATTINSWAE